MEQKGSDPEFMCPKTCGSKSCKGRIKLSDKMEKDKRCPGIPAGKCLAGTEKSPEDRRIANHWLSTGCGNKDWFRKPGGLMKVAGGHPSTADHAYFVNQ